MIEHKKKPENYKSKYSISKKIYFFMINKCFSIIFMVMNFL